MRKSQNIILLCFFFCFSFKPVFAQLKNVEVQEAVQITISVNDPQKAKQFDDLFKKFFNQNLGIKDLLDDIRGSNKQPITTRNPIGYLSEKQAPITNTAFTKPSEPIGFVKIAENAGHFKQDPNKALNLVYTVPIEQEYKADQIVKLSDVLGLKVKKENVNIPLTRTRLGFNNQSEQLPNYYPGKPEKVGFNKAKASDAKYLGISMPPAPVTLKVLPEDIQILKKLTNDQVGTILNPPIGKTALNIQQTDKYLNTILEKIKKASGISDDIVIKINMYASSEPIIFSQSLQSAEAYWRYTNQYVRYWPYRTMIGAKDMGVPIYEIGVNAGMLHTVRTEDELAFFLGKELSLIHQNFNEKWSEGWLVSQANSLASDVESLEWMKKAGYNPSSAIDGLDRIYAKAEKKWKSDYFNSFLAGTSKESSEGLRMATLQANIEKMKRESVEAFARAPIKNPEYIKIKYNPLRAPVNVNIAEELKKTEKLIQSHFLAEKPEAWVFSVRDSDNIPVLAKNITKLSSDVVNTEKVFKHGIEYILKSNASNQVKGDALINYMGLNVSVSGRQVFYKLAKYDPLYYQAIEKEFAKLTLAKNPWSASEFLKNAAGNLSDDLSNPLHTYLDVLTDDNITPFFKNLYKTNPEVKKLYEELFNYNQVINVTDRGTALNDFLSYSRVDKIKKNIMAKDFADLSFKNFKITSEGPIDLLDSSGNIDAYKYDLHFKYLVKNPEEYVISAEQYKVINQFKTHFKNTRDAYYLEIINKPNFAESSDVPLIIKALGKDYKSTLMISDEVADSFEKKLMTIAETWTKKKNMIGSDLNWQFDINDDFILDRFKNLFVSKTITKQQKLILLDYLNLNISPDSALNFETDAAKKFVESIRQTIKSLDKREIIEILGKDHFQQYAEVYSKGVAGINGTSAPGTTRAALAEYKKRVEAGDIDTYMTSWSKTFEKSGKMTGKGKELFSNWAQNNFQFNNAVQKVIDVDFGRKLGLLNIIGADKELSADFIAKMGRKDFDLIIKLVEDAIKKKNFLAAVADAGTTVRTIDYLTPKAGSLLFKTLDKNLDTYTSLDDWYSAFSKINKYSGLARQEDWRLMDKFESYVVEKLKNKKPAELMEWLKKDYIKKIMKPETISDLCIKTIPPEFIANKDMTKLGESLTNIENELLLKANHPEAIDKIRKTLASELNIQPGNVEKVFQNFKINRSGTQAFGMETRLLNSLSTLTRSQPMDDQVAMIEYLMGRKNELPAYALTLKNDIGDDLPVKEFFAKIREQLSTSDQFVRTHVTNSILAGPTSILGTSKGRDAMIEYLIKDITPKNKVMARELAAAMLKAEGKSESLAVSYVLSQPVRGNVTSLAEDQVLRNVLDAYGVPGKKLGQYLAFTSEMQNYRAALEGLQDAASDLSYLDAIQTVEKRFGSTWSDKIRIKKILGVGSVNAALEYDDLITGKVGVMSIAKENIENTTLYDFDRFKKVIQELTRTPEGMKKYGYLSGLTDIVEKSVKLEFDKQAAFEMQKSVQAIYNRTIDGWKVQTVDAFEQRNMTIFMEKAPGKTARKLLSESPEVYKSAMTAMSKAEMDVLRGIGPDGSPIPIAMHANPDFHDGQVLIDSKNKIVSILDFGQAVKISNAEREFAVDLLRFASKTDSPETVAKMLMRSEFAKTVKSAITPAEIREIFKRTDRMDIFINLVSLMERKGMDVPIPSVDWVMAANRQIALGEKIGVDNMKSFKHRVVADKLGMDQKLYNQVHLLKDKVCNTGVYHFFEMLLKK